MLDWWPMSYKSNNASFVSSSGVTKESSGSNPADSLSSAEVTALKAIAAETPNYVESSSCGTYTRTSSTYADITNLSVTFTVGSDDSYVEVGLLPDPGSTESWFGVDCNGASASNMKAMARIRRDTTTIAVHSVRSQHEGATTAGRIRVPVSSVRQIEQPGAGTYTYTVQLKEDVSGAAVTAEMVNAKLYAREIRR